MLVQKVLSAIMRTGEQIGFTMTIDILRASLSSDIVRRGYQSLRTFGAGRDVPFRDWQDYMLQMLQMGFIEIAYNEDRHLKVTELGKDVLYGKIKAELAVIVHEDLQVKRRRKHIRQEELVESKKNHEDESEEEILFERLRELRRQIAAANNWPAYVVMSDKSLHALATERPVTLHDFGNIFGIGEHKRDVYGGQFIAVIKEYPKKEIVDINKNACPQKNDDKTISCKDKQKQIYAKAYAPWTEEDDNSLKQLYAEGKSIPELMGIFERNRGAIRSRLKKLECVAH